MSAVVCFVVIPAVRIYLLVVSIGDYLTDIWLLLCYQVMQFFLIHKYISLPLCLLKLSIRELKIDFKSFFKKMIQEKTPLTGRETEKEMTLDLMFYSKSRVINCRWDQSFT